MHAPAVGQRSGMPERAAGPLPPASLPSRFDSRMLLWLRARNLALIEDVSVEFEPGLHVFTGETGSGKSLLLDALGLALGARAQARLVGPRGPRATIEAGFHLSGDQAPSAVIESLDRAGIAVDGGEVLIRRELRIAGPGGSVISRALVNGTAVPVGVLRSIGSGLAEIFGQSEHLTLLRPGAARDIVDSAGSHDARLAEVSDAHCRWRAAEARVVELGSGAGDTSQERVELERALREIETADPQPGERETLMEERRTLASRERLLQLLESAWSSLYGTDTSASVRIGRAVRELEAAAELDIGTARMLQGRADLLAEVEDLAESVRDRCDAIEAGPERLAEIEDRLALLRRLERRHSGGAGGPEALLARAEAIRRELAGLEAREATRSRAAADAEAMEDAYRKAARRVTAARREAARALEVAVAAELPGLGLPKARFGIRLEPAGDPCPDPPRERFASTGWDRVNFRFSANPGMPLASLSEVASGGETSRFFLALQAAAAERAREGQGSTPALVFDEVDAGVSGRVADAVGRRLRRLAADRQVLCVTHLPQVAALGGTHFRVEKLESGAVVRVHRLADDDRLEEIARMLAGPEVTEAARRNARDLLLGLPSPAPEAPST